MKSIKICFIISGLLLATAVQASVEINEETFPDEAFRSLIASQPEGKDGMLTDEELAGLKQLKVSDYDHKIQSFQGLEYLSELEELFIDQVYNMKVLDLSNNPKLEYVQIQLCGFMSLNLSGLSALKFLVCQGTLFQELDMSTCTALQYLRSVCGLLTKVNLSNNNNLKEVDLWDNQLTTLDLSNNINLEKVDCSYNQLTSLVLPQSETLTEVKCFANHLSAEHMDILVASLPTVSEGSFYPYIEVADVEEEGPQTEFNVCTTNQVETAKSKGWTVYGIYHITSRYWEEYAGSSTTGINSPTRQSPSATIYSVSGMPLPPVSSHKGIVIRDGRKVIVK